MFWDRWTCANGFTEAVGNSPLIRLRIGWCTKRARRRSKDELAHVAAHRREGRDAPARSKLHNASEEELEVVGVMGPRHGGSRPA